ncbi:MAG: 2-oxoacid:ferredoxin oxidoreductase subunit beta [Eubacteriales bacterium]|nr:2-oxoacid:ferredoxin oxidoreductase subunit beta [Eubacteriales bacterium]
MTDTAFYSTETAWCPGCGNFDIVQTLTNVLGDLQLSPNQVLLVGGIGQAAKLNQYVNANGFSGLHGRALPASVAAKMVNQALTVIVDTGDGDSYGEGGNHFLHNIRRNVDITHFAHDNQIYGLTKGQTSPTSDPCGVSPSGACNLSKPFKPLLVALAAGATFVARTFSGNKEHMAKIMKAAILHKGYALVDILQPCISFNKVNTFAYYKEHTYELEAAYDAGNLETALLRSMEYGPKIPLGIFYQVEMPTYHQQRPAIYDGTPMIDKKASVAQLEALLGQFA